MIYSKATFKLLCHITSNSYKWQIFSWIRKTRASSKLIYFAEKMCKLLVDRHFARRPLLVVWRCFQHLSLPLRFLKIPSSTFLHTNHKAMNALIFMSLSRTLLQLIEHSLKEEATKQKDETLSCFLIWTFWLLVSTTRFATNSSWCCKWQNSGRKNHF